MSEIETIIYDEQDKGSRLDKYLGDSFSDVSRSHFQKMISQGLILVNGEIKNSKYLLRTDDEIVILQEPVQHIEIKAVNIPLDILYEDDDVIVVNKPKGMVVHPAPGHFEDTLVNALMYHCKGSLSGINGQLRPGIVHRIDMDTTGSLIACKNDIAHNSLAEQLKIHSINRIYEGIVIGTINEEEGTIDKPIGRSPKDRKKMAIVPGKKEAITHFKVLKRFDGYTYVQFKLETGRTHQIRVHMASIGHPLLGDKVYGPEKCKFKLQGQTLHAKTLGFIHPVSNEYIEINAPLPDYFQKLLNDL